MGEEKLLIDDISMSELLKEVPQDINTGTVVPARILGRSPDGVLVNIGLKMDGLIPKSEFPDFEHSLPFKEGDTVPVLVRRIERQEGYTQVSWKAAREMTAWDKLMVAFRGDTPLEGVIQRKVKGGYVVDIGVDAFLPGSQLDLRPVRDVEAWVKQSITVLITEMDRAKSNVVVSRRKWLERERHRMRETTLATLAEGQVVTGRVASITDFGAFIDIGGIEGLLHISDMSWRRTEKAGDLLKVGQNLHVKVLKYDAANQRISLGLKQLQRRPWEDAPVKYPVGTVVQGRVTSLTSFGAFVELEPGIEGLIHISEFSWKERLAKPQDFVSTGKTISAKVLAVDPLKEKISLSLKRVGESPWELAKLNYPSGSRAKGTVTHMTSFGAFVMLPEGIEGLVHISDFSWAKKIKHPSEMVTVGQEIEAIVMDVKPEAEKIILSIKHLQKDPLSTIRVGHAVTGKVTQNNDEGLVLELPSGIESFIRKMEFAQDVDGKELVPAVGEEVTAKVTRVDARERRVELSIRRYEREEERRMVARYTGKNQDPLTLGDVLLETDESGAPVEDEPPA